MKTRQIQFKILFNEFEESKSISYAKLHKKTLKDTLHYIQINKRDPGNCQKLFMGMKL